MRYTVTLIEDGIQLSVKENLTPTELSGISVVMSACRLSLPLFSPLFIFQKEKKNTLTSYLPFYANSMPSQTE